MHVVTSAAGECVTGSWTSVGRGGSGDRIVTVNVVVLADTVAADPVERTMPSGDEVLIGGSACSDHSSVLVGGRCYGCSKRDGPRTAEEAIFAGYRDPFTERPAYRRRHGRGWIAGRTLARELRAEAERRDREELSAEQQQTLVALLSIEDVPRSATGWLEAIG